jgi:hypothetical protein
MTGDILEDLLPYCLRWWQADSWLSQRLLSAVRRLWPFKNANRELKGDTK